MSYAISVSACHGAVYTPGGGPVFAPAAAEALINVQPTQSTPQLVTQTVYGFLDFTTTIGNTVMVFSPQSATPPGEQSTDKNVPCNFSQIQ